MIFFRLERRLKAAEARLDALEARLERRPTPAREAREEEPEFPLDDAKLQAGIASLMGYDPFGPKRRDA